MYLITGNNETGYVSEGRDTLEKARQLGETWAKQGYTTVEIWLRTHSVEIRPQAFWTEHAKGINGSSKEPFK